MTWLLAIDPGPEQSAFVEWHGGALVEFGKVDNGEMLARCWRPRDPAAEHHLAIEMIASYGMPVGREVFDTCVMIGRYLEAWGPEHTLVYRREVKLHLCGSAKGKDSNVRQALIDRFGPGRPRAIGTARARGPLYGVSKDAWAALGVAVTWADAHGNGAM